MPKLLRSQCLICFANYSNYIKNISIIIIIVISSQDIINIICFIINLLLYARKIIILIPNSYDEAKNKKKYYTILYHYLVIFFIRIFKMLQAYYTQLKHIYFSITIVKIKLCLFKEPSLLNEYYK